MKQAILYGTHSHLSWLPVINILEGMLVSDWSVIVLWELVQCTILGCQHNINQVYNNKQVKTIHGTTYCVINGDRNRRYGAEIQLLDTNILHLTTYIAIIYIHNLK